MEDASIRRTDAAANQCNILNLNETENDIFLEIFTNTYAKIVDALSKKVKMQSMRSGGEMSSSFILKSGNQRRNNALPQMSNILNQSFVAGPGNDFANAAASGQRSTTKP